ncbi:dickkopf-related protein 4 [Callorhinchus milii]|uniref:dickkopf-related protein 4 n=1 Tax=Callorhinchus milii TaxID=7868 RepID=UPI0004574AFD|nr:dickkopf-related protein 4 [Callorhinchus milii]|eukprot:gi/632986691/ref/XP_007910379.1/ PREDICTED: dickkopf-related protein 4 [Callorhinchus milii]
MAGGGMVLLLCFLLSQASALVLDFNTIRSSSETAHRSGKASRCSADPDCGVERFCLASHQQEPVCATCRGVRRHCVREAMCCSGNHCLNNVCTRSDVQITAQPTQRPAVAQNTKESKKSPQDKPSRRKNQQERGQRAKETKQKNKKEKVVVAPTRRGLEGESCLRTSDCSTGLCCARHFWSKICRPVLKEGQVCSKRGRKEAPQGPEIFQRCDCAPGLTCRHQNQDTSQRRSRLRVCQGT